MMVFGMIERRLTTACANPKLPPAQLHNPTRHKLKPLQPLHKLRAILNTNRQCDVEHLGNFTPQAKNTCPSNSPESLAPYLGSPAATKAEKMYAAALAM